MNKPFRTFALFVIATSILCSNSRSELIKIGTMDDIPPYSNSINNQPDGLFIDILSGTFSQIGFTPKYHLMTYSRLLASLNNNSIDSATIIRLGDNYIGLTENITCSSHPLMSSSWGLFNNKLIDEKNTETNNKKIKTGIYRIIDYNTINEKLNNYNITTYRSNELLFKALYAKRISAVITDQITATYWSKHLNLPIKKTKDFGNVDIRVCFSADFIDRMEKQNNDFINKYSSATVDTINSGKVTDIITQRNLHWLLNSFVCHKEGANINEQCKR